MALIKAYLHQLLIDSLAFNKCQLTSRLIILFDMLIDSVISTNLAIIDSYLDLITPHKTAVLPFGSTMKYLIAPMWLFSFLEKESAFLTRRVKSVR